MGRGGLGSNVPDHRPPRAPQQGTKFHDKYQPDVLQKTLQRYIASQTQTPVSSTNTNSNPSKSKPNGSSSRKAIKQTKFIKMDVIEID